MAAGRIRGITIEIFGEAQNLSKAMANVNTAAQKTSKALKDINQALKFNPSSTNLLKQKQDALRASVEQTRQKLAAEKMALEQLQQAPASDKNKEQQDLLQREIAETEGKLKQLTQELRNFGSVGAQQAAIVGEKMKTVGQSMQNVGRNMTMYLSAPIVAGAASGVKAFAEVDKTMTLTNKTMGNSASQAKLLNDAMKDAAMNSTFGMNDAATASLNFARAGLNATEASQALAPAMNLAAGEGGNLDTVSAGLVATINGFGDSFDKTTNYADVFAAACNNSALDINSLSSSMSIAAPVFSAVGYSVNDAALYMGVMANAGIDANTAATALKTGMARLAKPTKDAQTWMDRLGISMFDENGKAKDSVTVQKELHDAFAGLTEEQKLQAASAIFGKNQMSNWLALINTAPEEVDSLSQSLGEASGTTQEMADAMMSGFGGSIEKLKSTLDVLKTTVGEVMSGSLQPIIDKITELADKFIHADAGTQKFILSIAGIVAAIGPALLIGGKLTVGIGNVLTAMPKITGAIQSVGGAFSKIGSAIMAHPVIAIGVVIAGIIAYLVHLYQTNEDFRNKVNAAWDTVKEKVSTVVEAVKNKFAEWKEKFSEIKQSVIEFVENTKQKWDEFKQKVTDVWNGIVQTITSVWDTIKTTVSTAIDAVKSVIDAVMNAIKAVWDNVWGAIKSGLEIIWNAIKSFISAEINGWKRIITTVLDAIKTVFSTVWNGIKSTATTVWNAIKSTATTVWNGVKSAVSAPIEAAKTTLTNIFNAIKSKATEVWNNIKTTTTTVWNNVKSAITDPINSAKSTVLSVFDAIRSGIKSKIDAAKDAVTNAIDKIKSVFNFKWSLPKLKLPHFSVSGSFSLNPPSIPKFGISWYKKAYDKAVAFTSPTVIPTVSGFKGFGDGRGAEIVMGEELFQKYAGDNINVQINVTGQPGQNVNELANIIVRKITQEVRREQHVFGA